MHFGRRGTLAASTTLLASVGLALTPTALAGPSDHGTAASSVTASTGTTRVGKVTTRYTFGSSTTIRSAAAGSAHAVGRLSAGQMVTGTVSGSWLQVVTPSEYAGKYIDVRTLSARHPLPTGCLASTARVPLGKGYPLCPGDTGVKVRLVRQALGLKVDSTVANGTYDNAAVEAVKTFQAHHHLHPNGQVDRATYRALQQAYRTKPIARYGFDVDGWVNSPARGLSPHASREQRIQAMLAWASAQQRAGMPYLWGGTGPVGYDCSGFVLQAMRAGGHNPKNVSNWTDVRPESDLARQLWADPEFSKGSLSHPQIGDLVYYGTSRGVVGHVAIYIGHNTVINAVGGSVQLAPFSSNLGWAEKVGINRAF